jgi:two-component system nitrate/nitrite response regulator NarL
VLVLTGSGNKNTLDQPVRRGARHPAQAGAAGGGVEGDRQGLSRPTMAGPDPAELPAGPPAQPSHASKSDADAHRRTILTSNERTVVQAVVEGNGALNKAIAERLFISEYTLSNHLTSIYRKPQVANRLGLYVYAVKHGLGVEQETMKAVD